jgi:oxygen-independent coproporphyrinogen III oxidase
VAGLYLHVPFCAAICNYCNFTRGVLEDALKTQFVAAMQADIRRHAEAVRIDSVYFGGGTPSLLTPAEVAGILDASRESFDLAPEAEITMEANPESVAAATLEGYRRAGVNRLSFGVQSFRDEELQRLGRLHSAERAVEAVALARSAGFDNLSLDLMLWLPAQTLPHLRESVTRLIDVGPEHASLYLLEVYPMARSGWSVAPDDDAADMYLDAMETLERAGYRQYEISNVARPGYESRHNLTYWRDGDWLAFGPGAHGASATERWRVVSGTGDYLARVAAGGDVAAERWPRGRATRLEEALFMGLRLVAGLDLSALSARYGLDVWETFGEALEPHVRAGRLVHEPGRRIYLTRAGMLVANDVMSVFIGQGITVE